MNNISLVGVCHHMARTMNEMRLMNAICESQFASMILPRVSDESIIYTEGWIGRVTPQDPVYEERVRLFCPPLLGSGKRPVLVGTDQRVQLPFRLQEQRIKDLQEMILFCENSIDVPEYPGSIPELLELVKKDLSSYTLTRRAPTSLKKAAGRLLKGNERFTRDYIQELEESAAEHDQCFLIAGAAHAIDLHLKTEWPIQILRGVSDDLGSLFRGYINTHVLPRLIRGW